MKRTTKKGFTLIELLAVIVILAIIALIAVPVILNIIDKANKSAFKDSAYGIISAGELYFAEQQLDLNGMTSDVTIELPDSRLELKGNVPSGTITITKDGDVSISVSDGRYCATKGFEDKDVTITKGTCGGNSNEGAGGDTGSTLSDIITTTSTCVTSGRCTAAEIKAGILVNVKVNKNDNYDFYVIKDDGTTVTLIMSENLGDNVAWITAKDYTTANIDGTSCDYESCNDEGPITAVSALKERTNGWTNIPEKNYTYSDDGGGNRYTAFTEKMRVRMLTYTETISEEIGCTGKLSCPAWLYANLYDTGSDTDSLGNNKYGYWTSTAHSSYAYDAWHIVCDGYVEKDATYVISRGIRPVIELSK